MNMNMNFNLNLEQSQKLIMTPELKQAIQILQFSSMELGEFINEELMSNPVLDKSSSDSAVSIEAATNQEVDKNTNENENIEKNKEKEIDWEAVASHFDDSAPKFQINYSKDDDVNYDNFVAVETTLREHLMEQVSFSGFDEMENSIAEYIIDNIDDNGYLHIDESYVIDKMKCQDEDFGYVLDTIQRMDPVGVGARCIEECLGKQLESMGYDDSIEMNIVKDYLTEMGSHKYVVISKKLEITIGQVQEACDFIRTLEPKPGRMFSSLRDVRYISADVTVIKSKGEYIIVVNETTAPKLYINSYYRKLLAQGKSDDSASEYVTEKLNSALRIIRSIEQRKNTIYNVCKSIVEYQIDFFEKGLLFLKPLNLKDIANEVGVHESTVSRAIHGKYIQCPNGLFEIKYFFQSGVKGSDGEGVSAGSVKSIIKAMIEREDTKKPISDQKIADQLGTQGVKISRRTVAKYRDELKIPASSKRKRY